jgi:hypothetical protein
MFNNKGESQMIQKNTKVFLVIKKTTWNDGETWFDVAEHSEARERAEQCMTALNTLKSDEKVSYLICEVDHANK